MDLSNFVEKAKELNVLGVKVSQNGELLGEWYSEPECRRNVYSATKSFTSCAVGFAVQEGLLSLDEKLTEAFAEDLPKEVDENLKKATVRDLLTMCLGQKEGSLMGEQRPLYAEDDWVKLSLSLPFVYEPGTHFVYNNVGPYLAGILVQRRSGCDLVSYLTPRLFKHLGIKRPTWETDPLGNSFGAGGLFLTLSELHKFGLFYLNKGKWNGKQLISEEWIDDAMGYTNPIAPVDGLQYNFHWDHTGDIWAARGMFGQTCGLVPSLDLVFAITAADSRYVAMKLFQKEIIDPVKAGKEPEIPDATADEILKQKGLRMTLEGKNVSVKGHQEFPKDAVWTPEENKDGITKVELHVTDGDQVVYVMEDGRGRHQVIAGLDHWVHGTTTMTGAYLHHQYEQDESRISAIAYWTDEHVLTMEWRFPEMAFWDHVSLTWDGDTVKMNRWVNMNSQDVKRPTVYLK